MVDDNGDGITRIDEAALLDALPDMVFLLDTHANVVFANAACRRQLDLDDDSLGLFALEFVHPDDVAIVATSMTTIEGKRVGSPIEFRIRNGHDAWQWVELIGSDCRAVAGVDGFLCVARDITERKRWEIAGSDVALFQHVFQHGASLTVLLDTNGRIIGANNALNRILGHDKSVAIGQPLSQLAAAESVDELQRAVSHAGATAEAVTVEASMLRADGRGTCLIRFELRSLGADPALDGIVATGQDISDLHLARQELRHLVEHDALTGAANRPLLESTVHALLSDSAPFALLFVDLDGFKVVNDRFGHGFGDVVLRTVASRLACSVRPGDLVARTGGDEFVVVVRGIEHREAATRFARRLEDVVSEPFLVDSVELSVRASIGVALSRTESTFDALVDLADVSMYARKSERLSATTTERTGPSVQPASTSAMATLLESLRAP